VRKEKRKELIKVAKEILKKSRKDERRGKFECLVFIRPKGRERECYVRGVECVCICLIEIEWEFSGGRRTHNKAYPIFLA